MDRSKPLVSFVVAMLVALPGLTLLCGCEHRSLAGPADPARDASKISVVTPERHTIYRLIQQPGYIRPYEETPIYSKIAGYVQVITVDKGSQVHKGDLLIKLWVPELEQDLAAKEAQVEQRGRSSAIRGRPEGRGGGRQYGGGSRQRVQGKRDAGRSGLFALGGGIRPRSDAAEARGVR